MATVLWLSFLVTIVAAQAQPKVQYRRQRTTDDTMQIPEPTQCSKPFHKKHKDYMTQAAGCQRKQVLLGLTAEDQKIVPESKWVWRCIGGCPGANHCRPKHILRNRFSVELTDMKSDTKMCSTIRIDEHWYCECASESTCLPKEYKIDLALPKNHEQLAKEHKYATMGPFLLNQCKGDCPRRSHCVSYAAFNTEVVTSLGVFTVEQHSACKCVNYTRPCELGALQQEIPVDVQLQTGVSGSVWLKRCIGTCQQLDYLCSPLEEYDEYVPGTGYKLTHHKHCVCARKHSTNR